MKPTGNCFESASNIIVDFPSNDILLCHGVAVGQGPIEGIKHTHAWLELNGMVLDFSNGKQTLMPKERYYNIGKLTNIVKYTKKESIKNLIKHKTYGPWDMYLKSIKY